MTASLIIRATTADDAIKAADPEHAVAIWRGADILANGEDDNMPMPAVNAAGLAEIHAFLAERHKLGGEHFTPAMLAAWAADAEFQMSEGNPPTIEIKSCDAHSGHTETYTVSDAGVEWRLSA
jgi:hypothetical protein